MGITGIFIYEQDGIKYKRDAANLIEVHQGNIRPDWVKHRSDNYYSCNNFIFNQSLVKVLYEQCMQSHLNDDIDVLIIGDSHAMNLMSGISSQWPNKNIAYIAVTGKNMPKLAQAINRVPSIKSVIYSSYWSYRLIDLPDKDEYLNGLKLSISILIKTNKNLFITDGLPHFEFDPKSCKYERPFSGNHVCAQDLNEFLVYYNKYYTILKQLETTEIQKGVEFIATAKYFCNLVECSMVNSNEIFYEDTNHLNISGEIFLAKKIKNSGFSFK